MSRWGKPIKNKKKVDPRYFLNENYYADIGIVPANPTDDKKAIKKAYRKRAMETHPDKGGDEEEFKAAANAYETLSDDAKKSQYDKELYNQTKQCKAQAEPDERYCAENGVDMSDEAMARFAKIAGIEEKSDTGDFKSKQLELYNILSAKYVEAKKGNNPNPDAAKNFMNLARTVLMADSYDDIADMYEAFVINA